MKPVDQRIFKARMDCLPLAAAFAEEFCEQRGVARADGLRLMLIVEELFTNTVKHGHGGDSDAALRIALAVGADHLTLCYEDSAPPFDPLQQRNAAPPDLEAELGDRAVGGLGVHLMTQMALSVDYAFVGGFNRVQLVLQRER